MPPGPLITHNCFVLKSMLLKMTIKKTFSNVTTNDLIWIFVIIYDPGVGFTKKKIAVY